MFRITNRLFSILAITILFAWPMHDLEARGKRGGSFGSSSSSSSRASRPAFSSSSSSSSSRSSWGSSSSSRSGFSSSRSDTTLSSKVNRGGTMQSRGEAMESRQSPVTSAPDYSRSPSRSSTSTSTSPQRGFSQPRVPQSMRLPDGRHAPVYMDQSRGGFGFWDSVGNWVLLSTILNSTNRGGYQPQYAPSAPSSEPSNAGTEVFGGVPQVNYGSPRRESSSGAGAVLAVIGLIVLAILISAGIFMHRMGSASRPQPLDARFTPPSRRNPMAPPITGTGTGPLNDWINLPPGSFVTLSDQQALEDARERGLGLRGIDYKVESVGVVKDFEGFASWVLLHLDDGYQKLILMVKGDESHIDHRVYYQTEDFRPAKREVLLQRGDTWLFEAPPDEHNVKPSHLRYAAEVPYSMDGKEIIYVRKDQGERHGEYTERPGLSGLGAMVATVVEYSTSDPTDNPELLVLEIATANSKTGEVSLFLGCPIRASEANIVKATT